MNELVVNENVIEFLKNQETATLTLCQGRFISKVKELANKYPEECKIIAENKDGSILAHLPVSWIRFIPPKKLSEEQKEKLIERLRK